MLKHRAQPLGPIRGQLAKFVGRVFGTTATASSVSQLVSCSSIPRVATPNSMTSLKDHSQIFKAHIRGVGFVVRKSEPERIEW